MLLKYFYMLFQMSPLMMSPGDCGGSCMTVRAECSTDWGRVGSGVSLLQINSLISARPRCYHCSLLDEELEKQRSNEGTLLTETQIYFKPFIRTL